MKKDLAGLTMQPTDGAPAKESGSFIGNTSLWGRLHGLGDTDNADGSSIGSSHPLPSSQGPWSAQSSSHGRPRVTALQSAKPTVASPPFRQVTFTSSHPSIPSTESGGFTVPRQWERPSVHDPPPGRPSNIPYSSRETEPAWFNTTTTSILAAERAVKEEEERKRAAVAKLIDDSEDASTTKGKKPEPAAGAQQPITIRVPAGVFPPGMSRQPRRAKEEPANKDPYSFW